MPQILPAGFSGKRENETRDITAMIVAHPHPTKPPPPSNGISHEGDSSHTHDCRTSAAVTFCVWVAVEVTKTAPERGPGPSGWAGASANTSLSVP